MEQLHETPLDGALAAFYAGDVSGLTRLLRADPALVRARVTSTSGHYCGYFHEATLLHHVAGNPSVRPLPRETVDLAELLLDHGAEVDAATHAGPSQPDDIGWSTLGLVATSLDARVAGHQRALLELLLDRGADPNFHNGGPLIGALYYSEQPAAAYLVQRGARVDLVAAAGLGRIDLMARFVRDDGSLTPDAHTLVHYSQKAERPTTAHDILSVALVYACLGGHTMAAEWLLDHGAPGSGRAPFDHDASPLHWAALHDHGAVCDLLLARGADRGMRDTSFDATASGWAAHGGHEVLAARLARP
jgi:hypothetical protein